jgi:3-phosphoshikimate 1-carboxyvinyltransferase
MGFFTIEGLPCVKGKIFLPGDKSIAHRAVILGALSCAKTTVHNFPLNRDCLSTIRALQKLGIKIKLKVKSGGNARATVFGRGLSGLDRPQGPIFVGDSGTTFRLLLGVLAGQDFKVRLVAGKSLSQRPMLRVTAPLKEMGAVITSQRHNITTSQEEYPPVTIQGGNLRAITYKMPVASAQVKSAILLAGLSALGTTSIIEPIKTRDHTERMLKLFKAEIKLKANNIVIKGNKKLVSPGDIYIPGDISSAGFFMVLAAILSRSEILIRNVNLNPSRTGIVKVLRRMGADIKVARSQSHKVTSGEPMGDILVKSSKLRGTVIKKEELPSLIDELPVLMVAACCAKGRSIFKGVEELRVKETDRIKSMLTNLQKMGADIKVTKSQRHNVTSEECVIIKGVMNLKGAKVRSFGDHRTAMSMVVAGLKAKGQTFIDDLNCINKSFPGFLTTLRTLIR